MLYEQDGVWIEEWLKLELMLLPKKPGIQDGIKYRNISLVSHASKILFQIIRQRLQYCIRQEIAEQFSFALKKGTRDAILAVNKSIQKVVKKQNNSCL